jgi:hypothetical protein
MMNYLLTPISHKLCRAQLLLVFRRPEAEEALVQICDVLRAEGYEQESGPAGETLFGRGNKAGRLLGGGLSSRQEFQVTSEQDGDLAGCHASALCAEAC